MAYFSVYGPAPDSKSTANDSPCGAARSGGMIFTFYKAQGLAVGSSLVEEDKLDLAKELEAKAKEKVHTLSWVREGPV